ncbi:hypothetical protein PLEOSDRAFT_1105302 [Pleurotus ostreatus PC15]|uniref:Fungal-type protein kinase domain-containing protein n=1 Tax=Pleurotus ostreatus (strain PC15) TaxID=1137138 RepID=A0A067NEZ6_PLEO1|nr:hypothetical protein PLEOSDRAFT_1105302 [Pleurotus ostreatus PC15]
MADHFAFTTSPLKDTKKAAGSRKEMSALEVREEYTKPYSNFSRDHLNAPPGSDFEILLEADKTLVALTESYVSAVGKPQYSALCNVLNHLSEKFCGDNEPIVFVEHHTAYLKHHPNGYFDCSPDIPAMLKSIFLTYPSTSPCKCAEWSDLETVVEVKNEHEYLDGITQLAAYLGLANQARPDKVGIYGLITSPSGYQIQYSDAGGLTTSPFSDWEHLVPLASYVYTLYFPLPGRPRCDPTITRSSTRIEDKPTWDVTFKGETYPACQVKFVGQPWKRMTWVAQTAGKYPTVIKDSYWAYGRTFKEGELYDLLQAEGKPAPGFVRMITHGDVFNAEGPITSINIEPHVYRVKTRLIMGTSGDPLAKTPSIQHFLMAMYDVLECHRWAVKERNIIHRDISPANIMINPKDKAKELLREPTRPIFIKEILLKKKYALPVARLYDFDNSAENDRLKAKTQAFKESLERSPDHEHLRHRTGTPRFMARAVAAGHILEPDSNVFEPMPSLPPKILVRYQNAHSSGENPLRQFEDCNGTIHGGRSGRKRADNDTINNPDEGEPTTGQSTAGQSAVDRPPMDQSTMNQAITNQSSEDKLSEDESDHDESDHLAIASLKSESDDNKPTQGRSDEQIQIFRHLPRHDAESVFWVIVVFLLRALPLGQLPEKDKNTKSLISSWKCIASHEIMSSPAGLPIDFRTMLLSPKHWETNLHEKLGGLVPMMKELVMQVRPEYSHLAEPPPDEFHLHEAMQRILLRYAVKFSEASDIFLNTEKGRIVLEKKDPPEQRASTNISLDGQHFQRAGHRSHFSVSQGSDSIIVDKRKRRDSIEANSYDSQSSPLPARSRFPDIPRTIIAGDLDVFPPGVTREEYIFRDKRRRMQ